MRMYPYDHTDDNDTVYLVHNITLTDIYTY